MMTLGFSQLFRRIPSLSQKIASARIIAGLLLLFSFTMTAGEDVERALLQHRTKKPVGSPTPHPTKQPHFAPTKVCHIIYIYLILI